MIEQIIQWLKDGDDHDAALLLTACSIDYIYVDTMFEIDSDRSYDLFDVNIEAPRKVFMLVMDTPLLKNKIEIAVKELSRAMSEFVRHISWVPKFASRANTPAEEKTSDVLSHVDLQHIRKKWDIALARKDSDAEGAITVARTVIESVCKYILDKNGVMYSSGVDLPKLYYMTSDLLSLAPSQHSDKIVRQILGNCQAVISGISSLRNDLGDAHGKGEAQIIPEPMLAELAVNLAGTMAIFLLSAWENSANEN